MLHRYSQFLSLIRLIGDVFMMNLAFIITYWVIYGSLNVFESIEYKEQWLFANFILLILYFIYKPFRVFRTERILHILKAHFSVVIIHALLISCFVLFKNDGFYKWDFILLSLFIFGILVFCWSVGFILTLRKYRQRGYNYRRVVIMGYGELAEELKSFFLACLESDSWFTRILLNL